MPIIFIAGDMLDTQFHEAKLIADDLAELDSTISVEVRAMVEDDYAQFVIQKKRAHGGKAYEHAGGPFIVHSSLGYIGGVDELVEHSVRQYGYSDPRQSAEAAVILQELAKLANQDFQTHVANQTNKKYCYIEFQVGKTEERHRIAIELHNDKCPKTCENFLGLIKGAGKTDSGINLHYKGTPVHRVVPDAWVQMGDVGSGRGGTSECIWGGQFEDESFAIKHNAPGIIGMANNGPHTNGSQFYITQRALPFFDGKKVAFGKVKAGMKALQMLNGVNASNQRPREPITIVECGELEFSGAPKKKPAATTAAATPAAAPTKKITLLVCGVEGSGKSTIVNNIANDPTKKTFTTMGLEREKVVISDSEVTFFGLGGAPSIRDYWDNFYAEGFGAIYVVDASDEAKIEEAKMFFDKFMGAESMQGKPILLLANKQDLASPLSAAELANKFGIEDNSRIKVMSTTALVKEGGTVDTNIISGASWLVSRVGADYEDLKERIAKDVITMKEKRHLERQERMKAFEERKAVRDAESEAAPPTTEETPAEETTTPASTEEAPATEETPAATTEDAVSDDDAPWMSWGAVDEGNPNNRDDFKYKTYSELPPMVTTANGGKHKSLMAKFLTPELFEQLKDVKTSKGYTLSHAIQTGVMTPHLGVGITAGDEESWEVFKDIYYPIIQGWHNYDPATQNHVSDLNPDNVNMDDATVELFNKYVKSTRIRAARNISGYALPAGSSAEDREGVCTTLKAAFAKFEGDLAGTFYDLGSLTDEQSTFLRDKGFLFQKPKPTNLLTYCGAARDWPDSRGIFHNENHTALAWCNEEDHCRIISMSEDGNVKGVFARFAAISDAIKTSIESDGGKFMFSEKLGFLGTCPSNLGTGLRASVMVVLKNLNEDPVLLEEICDSFDLQPRGSAGEHSAAVGGKWDISNKQRLGFSEVQLVQKMIDGVSKLIALEEKLANGEKLVKGVDYGTADQE